MNNLIMTWLVTIVGLAGFFLAGKKIWWAWYVNIFCQVLWVIYAITSQQYVFILAAACYIFVFTKNAYAWTIDHRLKQDWVKEWAGKSVRAQVLTPNEARDCVGTTYSHPWTGAPEAHWPYPYGMYDIYVYSDLYKNSGVLLLPRKVLPEAEREALVWLDAYPDDIVMLVEATCSS